MESKIEIRINGNLHEIEIAGNPLDILMELTLMYDKHPRIMYLMKTAIEMAEILGADPYYREKAKENKQNKSTENHFNAEGFAIIENFMEHYKQHFN